MTKLEQLIQEKCPNGVEYIKLGKLIEKAPKSPYGAGALSQLDSGEIIAFTSGNKTFFVNEYLVDGEYIFMNDGGQADTKYYNGKANYTDHVFAFTSKNINIRFLFHYLLRINEIINKDYFRGGGIKNLVKKEFLEIEVPVPPLEVQREIVEILDKFTLLTAELTAELTARKEQYKSYLNSLLDFNNRNIEFKTVGELFEIRNGLNKEKSAFGKGKPIINFMDVYRNRWLSKNSFKGLVDVNESECERYSAKLGDVFFTRTSETQEDIGMSSTLVEDIEDCVFSGFVLRARPKTKLLLPKFCAYYFSTDLVRKDIIRYSSFTTRATTTGPKLSKIKVPMISIKEQQRIVDILDRFDTLCNDISSGLPAEIEARQKQYEYYRDKLLTFKRV